MDFDSENEIFTLAENAFKDNDYTSAEPLLNQLVLKSSRRPEVYHMLGTIYYDQGKFNKAIRSFKRALEIDSSFTDSSIGLSIILNDLGRYDEGRKVFDEAKAMLTVNSRHANSALNEKLSTRHDELGELYFKHNRLDEALEQYHKAYSLTNMRRPELAVQIANCYIQQGNISHAIRDLRNLIREYPHFVPGRMLLGKCHYDLQQMPEALEQWEAILKYEPHNQAASDYLRLAQTIHVTTLNSPRIEL